MDSETNGNHTAMDVDPVVNPHSPSHLRTRPLTRVQERRLIAYLDERLLQFTRNFTKRSDPSSTLRTLEDYLEEARHILAFVLQIPPVDPSASLRVAYILRLTTDVLGGIPGYSLTKAVSDPLAPPSDSPPPQVSPQSIRNTLRDLLDFLDDLDQAWLAVLQGQVWDPSTAEGVDLSDLLQSVTLSDREEPIAQSSTTPQASSIKSRPMSATEVTRLRSLLLGGESALEEWLANEKLTRVDGEADDGDDLSGALARMGLLDEFDNLFAGTMDLLGFHDIRLGLSDEEEELEEIPMSAPTCVFKDETEE